MLSGGMADIRLWLETTHHAAFRYGGWAYVRAADGAVVGYAGGERNITPARLDLAGMIAALNGLPAGASIAVRTSNPALLAIGRLIASPPPAGSPDAPVEDLDLWAQLMTAARKAAGVCGARGAACQAMVRPLAAWAEVGRDKAKSAGRFAAAIPKPNLAKLALA